MKRRVTTPIDVSISPAYFPAKCLRQVVRKFASERVSLAKALIRAVQPKAKKNNKEKPAEGTDGDPKAPAP